MSLSVEGKGFPLMCATTVFFSPRVLIETVADWKPRVVPPHIAEAVLGMCLSEPERAFCTMSSGTFFSKNLQPNDDAATAATTRQPTSFMRILQDRRDYPKWKVT